MHFPDELRLNRRSQISACRRRNDFGRTRCAAAKMIFELAREYRAAGRRIGECPDSEVRKASRRPLVRIRILRDTSNFMILVPLF
jgi:hypothetical protein